MIILFLEAKYLVVIKFYENRMTWKTHANETGDCGLVNRKPKIEIEKKKPDETEAEIKPNDDKETFVLSDDDDEIQILSS